MATMVAKPYLAKFPISIPKISNKKASPPRVTFNSDSMKSKSSELIHQFNPKIPIEKAKTPPSSWYTRPSFLQLELHRVFYTGWQAVGTYILSVITFLTFTYIFIVAVL